MITAHHEAPRVRDAGGFARRTAADRVAEHIRQLIFDNRLHTGQRVPQSEIAASLQVSRVPVREAVIALDHEGWVTNEPYRGAFVNGLDENSIRDQYEVLGMLHGYIARCATERGTDRGVEALASVHRRLQASTLPDEFHECSSEFLHQMLILAGSRRVTAMSALLTVNLVPGNFFAEVPGAMRIQRRALRVVMQAIRNRQGFAAERAFSAMLRTQADSVIDLFEARGLLPG